QIEGEAAGDLPVVLQIERVEPLRGRQRRVIRKGPSGGRAEQKRRHTVAGRAAGGDRVGPLREGPAEVVRPRRALRAENVEDLKGEIKPALDGVGAAQPREVALEFLGLFDVVKI